MTTTMVTKNFVNWLSRRLNEARNYQQANTDLKELVRIAERIGNIKYNAKNITYIEVADIEAIKKATQKFKAHHII